MLRQDKRSPSLEDLSPMPFGKYKGKALQDIPASYLKWLYNEMKPKWDKYELSTHSTEVDRSNVMLYNYIHNFMEAIEMEET